MTHSPPPRNPKDFTDQDRLTLPNAGMRRRIAALIYDSFLILAIWMLSSLAILAATDLGESLGGPLYQGFLYLELMAFYLYFWTFKGQTLGMQVWRLVVIQPSGGTLTRRHPTQRSRAATPPISCLGLGLFWILVNPERAALHDLLTCTRVGQLPKP